MELLLVGADAIPEGPLSISIDVHLDNASLDCVPDVLLGGSRTAVEDKGDRLVRLAAELLIDELLGAVEDLGLELDVAGGVDAVDVSEGGSNSETSVLDLGKRLENL